MKQKISIGLAILLLVAGLWRLPTTEAVKLKVNKTLLKAGEVLTIIADAGADRAATDSVVGGTKSFELCDRYVIEYGLSYLSDACSLGIDNDSGACPIEFQTRLSANEGWWTFWRDTLHKVGEGYRDTLIYNEMCSDSIFGREMRVIVKLEMDVDSSAGDVDTVIFNGIHIYGFDVYD